MEMLPAVLVVAGYVGGTLLLGWWYFACCMLARPPLGVINGWDVWAMIGGIILAPLLYLGLPGTLATAILGLGVLGILYALVEPLLPSRWACRLTVFAIEGADITTGIGHAGSIGWAVNDGVIILVVVGLANLWAQGGMTARALIVLVAFLSVYDVIATSWLPLTTRLTEHLSSGPFAPVVSWGSGRHYLALGLGDLVLATVFPLVMRKAYGDAAVMTALAVVLTTLIGLLVAVSVGQGARGVVLPVMIIVGPVMIVHYIYWARRSDGERTTTAYRRAQVPLHIADAPSP